jgi:hypothetical protein
MPDSIITRIREDLIYNLEGITEQNGFCNTVKEVYNIGKSPENGQSFPAIEVDFVEYTNEKLGGYQIDWVASVDLIISLQTDDPIIDRETILTDVKQKLYENAKERIGFIPNENGDSVCTMIEINKVTFSGIQETKPNYKVTINLEVKFSESLSDSYSLP